MRPFSEGGGVEHVKGVSPEDQHFLAERVRPNQEDAAATHQVVNSLELLLREVSLLLILEDLDEKAGDGVGELVVEDVSFPLKKFVHEAQHGVELV